jgi:hypothetical protein
MRISDIPFGVTDWDSLAPVTTDGESGYACWRTQQFGDMRLRMGDLSAGYVGSGWCRKGHIVLVVDGLLVGELADGSLLSVAPGQSLHLSDDNPPHRFRTAIGARIFVVD